MKNRAYSWLVCKIGVREDSSQHNPFIYREFPPRENDAVSATFPGRHQRGFPGQQPARWMAPLPLVIDLVNGVESQRFCLFYFIGFSMGKCQIYRLQPWERTLTCIYIYVCLFAGLDMASSLTYKCMFVCMFGLGFRPYKTLQDTEWLQLPQSWGSQNKT